MALAASIADTTPVIIGVGQASERVGEPGYAALSTADLGGRALAAALADAGAGRGLAARIDTLAAIRAFDMSRPGRSPRFGGPDNVPRAFARRVGAHPARAILSTTGGHANQLLLGECAAAIAAGSSQCAAIVGAEAISTVRALAERGEAPDWSEEVGGDSEDRGYGFEDLIEPALFAHGASAAIPLYALAENARRARRGLGLAEYRLEIGWLFAPFTAVAAANPHAAAPILRSAEELATITAGNRILAEPYLRLTAARDQVNQAAAILVASAGLAREMGVPEARWVHIHAVATANERKLSQRPDLAISPAAIASIAAALARAGKGMEEVRYLDLYSCFAIPVLNVCDHFGLAADDPRGLTLTGGLPFFGGAGNNYSAHAIAEAVMRVRADRGSFALVGANAGWMSKYAAGIYSAVPADWRGHDRALLLPTESGGAVIADGAAPSAVVETYTITRSPDGDEAIVLGRTEAGARVAANADLADPATAAVFESGEPFGARLTLRQDARGRTMGRFAAG